MLRRLCLAILAALPWGVASAGDWSQFRGGPALGVAADAAPPTSWSNESHLAWRTPIPGSGWSQPVIAAGRIYVTTAVSGGNDRPKAMMGGVMDLSTWGAGGPPKKPLSWQVLCLDPVDGRILWSRTAVDAQPKFGKHASNTYATETPCASADGVWAFFGATGTLVAYDTAGTERWKRDFGPQPVQNQFGTGSSPVLHDGRLFLQLYNDESARLVCLDAASGEERWSAEREKGTAWSTPIVWDNAGTTEIVTAGNGSVIAYTLADGTERWRLGGLDTSFACSITADADGVYLATSSPGSKAPGAMVAPGHLGDLTLPKGSKQSPAVPWFITKSGAGMPSPVVLGDLVWWFGNTATCYDKRTGVEKYRKRLPGGTLAAGCPVVAGGRIYLVNERGKTLVLKAGPEFEVLGESEIGPGDEVFWATPAVAGDALFIRSSDALYCIRE